MSEKNKKQKCYTCPTGATIFIPEKNDDMSIVVKRSEGRASPPFLIHNFDDPCLSIVVKIPRIFEE
ncbi:MAG: hypothetical protein H6791_00330 [Candidatus Nomurabacteria bacterium]|nr:MAG: hypothetical protein H6791_00330 [Candidatus Nomurabacteria bacterium]